MKKKLFSIVLLLLCAITLLSACNLGNFGNNNTVVAQSGRVPNKRYSTKKGNNTSKPVKSFYDDNYYYYYFYLGGISDVPLQAATEVPYYHYTGNYYTKEFESTKTTSTSVENACITAVTNTTTLSKTGDIKVGISYKAATEMEAGLSSGMASASAKVSAEFSESVEFGLSLTSATSATQSRNDTYKEVATKSETTTEKTKFEFTTDSKVGYYRYIMTGSVDVYTVVIYSIKDETYYFRTLTEVMSYGYSFDFSESARFDDNKCGSLEFDCSLINNLQKPTELLTSNGDSSDANPPAAKPNTNILPTKNVCKNSTGYTVTDKGVYGLAQNNYDVVDLTGCSKYFNGDYLFRFAVTLKVSKIDAGYQEIYLYSGTENTGKTVDLSTAIADYGLIRGSIMTHESGAYDHHIYWDVSGDELKNCTNAYIRYDASGNGSDSWNKNAISVDVTIIKKIDSLNIEEISLDQEITVTDTGVFGLAARDHDQIDLSKYSNYMNSDYVFMFDVTLNMSEKNDGYQEIYLYNKFDVTTSDDKKTIAYAREHGLVWATNLVLSPSKIETTATNNYFSWAITGNNIANTMYIRYDAHGDNADTWYKHSMTITLKIFYAPAYTPDESVLDVLI